MWSQIILLKKYIFPYKHAKSLAILSLEHYAFSLK